MKSCEQIVTEIKNYLDDHKNENLDPDAEAMMIDLYTILEASDRFHGHKE